MKKYIFTEGKGTYGSNAKSTTSDSFVMIEDTTFLEGFTLPWNSITNKPTAFPPTAHEHSASEITSGVFSYARLPFSLTNVNNWNTAYSWGNHANQGYLKTLSWTELTGKPTSFPPTSHTHTWSEITGKPTLAPSDAEKNVQSDWNETNTSSDAFIQNKPNLNFLPLAGGSLNTDSQLIFPVGNTDLDFLNVRYNNGDTLGFFWRYTGTQTGNENGLELHTSTNLAYRLTQDGVFNFNKTPYVNTNQIYHEGNLTNLSQLNNDLNFISEVSWNNVLNKPSTFPPSSHTHSISQINNLQTTLDGKSNVGHSHSWSEITSKPTTFTPSSHTLDSHSNVNITSNTNGEILRWNGTQWVNNTLSEAGIKAANWVPSWSEVTGKPTSFTPSTHSHPISQITNLQTTLNNKANTSDLPTKVSQLENDENYLKKEEGVGGRNLFENSAEIVVANPTREYAKTPIMYALEKAGLGAKITISFDVEAVKGDYLNVYCSNTKGPLYFSPSKTFTNFGPEKQRLSFTTNVVEGTVNDITELEFYSTYDSGDFFEISNIKIEKGEVATDWTPAPEDKADITGTYPNLRAQSTTKEDVGLSNVPNLDFRDYGLGTITPTTSQLDNLVDNQFFSASPTNTSVPQYGSGFTASRSSTRSSQFVITNLGSVDSVRAFIRQKVDTWGVWRELWHSGNSDSFNSTGTYSGLRAQATTKADVGLGSVDNYSRAHYDGRYASISRTISAGTGLTGGGSLDANRTISIDSATISKINNGQTAYNWGNNRIIAIDDRDVKPEDVPTSSKHIRAYFTSLGGMTGTANSDYQDLLVLSTYSDSSGGKINALSFDKSEQSIKHYQASFGATTWGSYKELAYTEGTYPNLRAQATTKADVGLSNVPNWLGSTSTSLGTSNTVIPSQGAVKSYVDSGLSGKANTTGTYSIRATGTTKADVGLSNVPNWSGSTSTSLGTSDTTIPSQGAVKSYVDSGLSGKANTSGTYSGLRAQATTKADVGLSNVPNWSGSTSTSLGTSNTTIPSQGAVKAYVDNAVNATIGGVAKFALGTYSSNSNQTISQSVNYVISANTSGRRLYLPSTSGLAVGHFVYVYQTVADSDVYGSLLIAGSTASFTNIGSGRIGFFVWNGTRWYTNRMSW